MEKSRVFALAMPSNLVNEKNYVMEIEYFMAWQAEKEILAAEICPTNRDLLARHYVNLSSCLDVRGLAALSAVLIECPTRGGCA